MAGCAAVRGTYSAWGEEEVSELEPVPKLGTYSGEIHHDEDRITSVSVNLRSRFLADFTFYSSWTGYESVEPLEGACTDVRYTSVSSSVVLQSECLSSIVEKWNAQIGNGRFFDREIELKFSHDTLDGSEAFGQALVLEHMVDAGDLVELDWSKLRIQMTNEEYPEDINNFDEPSEQKAEEEHGGIKKGLENDDDDEDDDDEDDKEDREDDDDDDDDDDERKEDDDNKSSGDVQVTSGPSAAADL
jgi:hypothetical protein